MRLIIVRHGETEENVKEIMMGQSLGKLTQKGKGQAKKAALRLKNEKIDIIFSSDLPRAEYTAKEVVKFHKVPIHYTPELREKGAGIFEGRPVEELYEASNKSGLPKTQFKPEGGESFVDVKKRAQKFLDKLFKNYKNKTILISSHGGCIKMLLGILLKKPIEEARKLDQANACVNIIEIREDYEHKAQIINCIKHL